MTMLTIAPSERFELLADFSDGASVLLETAADRRAIMGMGRGMMGGMTGSGAGGLMRFDVDASLPAAVKAIPGTLVALAPPTPSDSVSRRRISLDMGPGMMGPGMMRGMGGRGGMGMGPPVGINGRTFDMGRIDFEPRLGSSEIWEVTPSMMAHPFHVHGVIFRVLSIGGRPPAAHLAGGKDTILLDGPAELLMQFTQPATSRTPFMFHCHILEHEDAGMMGQYATI
jgi:FtsP/CotA-like multicopper oxidase with cupredoxin domain